MTTNINYFDISPKKLAQLVKEKKIIETYSNVETLAGELKTSLTDGLSQQTTIIKKHSDHFGENFIPPKMPHGFFYYVYKAMQEPILIFLTVAAIIIFVVEIATHPKSAGAEGLAIFVAVIVIVLITAISDFKKERQFKDLQKSIKMAHSCFVVRGGITQEIKTKDLVVGDIYLLKYGDQVAADAFLISGNDLRIDESSLTGESDYVHKTPEYNPYLISGTNVMEGSGKAIVMAVGIYSEIGAIMNLMGLGKKEKKPKKNRLIENEDADQGDGPPLNSAQNEEDEDEEEDTVADYKTRSILQEKLTKLAALIGKLGVAAGVIVVVVLTIRYCVATYTGENRVPFNPNHLLDFLRIVVTGMTIIVVAVPEGLPLAVTLALAYSVNKMYKENNLVRQLYSCETMGNATTICSDKTGTLTTNRMTVVELFYIDKYVDKIEGNVQIPDSLMEPISMNICINKSDTSIVIPPKFEGGLPDQLGNKTDCALIGLLNYFKIDVDEWKKSNPFEVVKSFPFNSRKKYMTTIVKYSESTCRVLVKGAPDFLLSECKFFKSDGDPSGGEENINKIKEAIRIMSSHSLRIILLAYKDISSIFNILYGLLGGDLSSDINEDSIATNLTFLCLFGIEDPLRMDVPEAIRICGRAGVTVRMVTGDSLETAISIAMKCGIIDRPTDETAMTSETFNKCITNEKGQKDPQLFDKIWPNLRVLARSSPQDKYTLVDGIIKSKLSGMEQIVAVTGDGTNDAPALKRAHVGFSMGVSGTDVAKEASDIVLLDDNFATIIRALLWGRNVYDSIAKFLQFQLTVNTVVIASSIIISSIRKENVLTTIQLLWVNLIMDSLGALALVGDPPTMDLLNRKPYGKNKSLLSSNMIYFIGLHSVYQFIVLLILVFAGPYLFGIDDGLLLNAYNLENNLPAETSQHLTIVFNTFVLMQWCNLINARKIHGEKNVFSSIHENFSFLIILSLILLIQALIIQFTFQFFQVRPITFEQWLWCLFTGFSEMVYHQIIMASIPHIKIPKRFREIKGIPSSQLTHPDLRQGRILWLRGIRRLQQQLRIIEAFKSGIQSSQSQTQRLLRTRSHYPNILITNEDDIKYLTPNLKPTNKSPSIHSH